MKSEDEILEFLEKKQWTAADQSDIVEHWNRFRGDELGRIGTIQVRTPCRLRQIRNSLRGFLIKKKAVL